MGGPTNKRIQVALRAPVLSIIETYAKEQGISNSKAVARLVEEGLIRRGLLEGQSWGEVPGMGKAAAASYGALQDMGYNLPEPTPPTTSMTLDDKEAELLEDLKLLKKIRKLREAGDL